MKSDGNILETYPMSSVPHVLKGLTLSLKPNRRLKSRKPANYSWSTRSL